jgi:hypothetical protein
MKLSEQIQIDYLDHVDDSESWMSVNPDILRDWKQQAETLESQINQLEKENIQLRIDINNWRYHAGMDALADKADVESGVIIE